MNSCSVPTRSSFPRLLTYAALAVIAANYSDSSVAPYNGPKLTNAIVLVCDRNGSEEIYSMNADGSNIHQLTSRTKPWAIAISPPRHVTSRVDGAHIPYVRAFVHSRLTRPRSTSTPPPERDSPPTFRTESP
jgi:hypothetical protein